MKIVLDAACMQTRKEAHTYLQKKLNFPPYYGKNLDALYDCLTELADTEILIENSERAETYYKRVQRVFLKAAEANPGLTLVIK